MTAHIIVACGSGVATSQTVASKVERLLKAGEVELLDTVALANECAPEALDVPAAAGVIAGYKGRTLQLWDHRFGTDLMFVACLRKR